MASSVKNGLASYFLGLLGGFSSLGLYCFFKHFLKCPAKSNKADDITRLKTDDPRASQIVLHNRLVYISGQVGDISKLEESDVTEQMKQTLEKVDQLLDLAGTNKSRILETRIWLKNIKDDFSAMNQIWNNWIDPNNKGVRYCVEAHLARPSLLVEVQVVAAATK